MTRRVAAGALVWIWSMSAAPAQDRPSFEETGPSPGVANGAGVFHGNYCGIGDNGPGLAPIDALDRACMHHDACTPSGGVPSCACNARFLRETRAVAASARSPQDLRALAEVIVAAVPVIPCR